MTEPLSGAVVTKALRLASLEVGTRLRDEGKRIKDYEARDLTKLAEVWFKFHRAELIGQATIGLLREKARKSRASVVQISRSKVEA
jgi:hypothetical protein